jgi:hypothetical protein
LSRDRQWTELGLVTWFTLQLYTSLLCFTYYCRTLDILSLLQSSLAVTWWQLPTSVIPLSVGSPLICGLKYQLLRATAHNWIVTVST